MRHDWLIERITYPDGDENFLWGFAYMELQWPPRFGIMRFRHDGLPIVKIDAGPLLAGWGQTHEWFCCEDDAA